MSKEYKTQFNVQTAQEKNAKETNFVTSIINSLIGASWFAALSKLSAALSKFFTDNKQYFFFGSQILSLANFIIYTIEYAGAANKNASKTASLAYRTLALLFAATTAIVMMLFSASVGTFMLGVSLFIDPIINLCKSIFFAVNWYRMHKKGKPEQAAMHKKECLMCFGFFVGGLAVALGFVALYMFPAIPLAATAAIAIIGGLVAVVPYLIIGIKKIVDHVMGRQPQANDQQRLDSPSVTLIESVPVKSKYQPIDWHKKGFYAYCVSQENTDLTVLKQDVIRLRGIIERRETQKHFFLEKHFCSPQAHQPKKEEALKFLENFIDFLQINEVPERATKAQPFIYNNQPFYYQNMDQFIQKFDRYALKMFPGEYQSYGRKIGRVQACFNQVYAYLRNEQAATLRMRI